MIKYKVSYQNPGTHYIDFELDIPSEDQGQTELQFPTWRPGRYEKGNFAKNIQSFKVYSSDGKPLSFKKTSKDTWLVNTDGYSSIKVMYNYYAYELNAGSSYLDDQQLYINPVNCFLYRKELIDAACEIELVLPTDYEIACAVPFNDNKASFKDYHELVDSPFIASASMQHQDFECCGVKFHLWFQGQVNLDWARIKRDFIAYTKKQFEAFDEFPFDEYHYMYQISHEKLYHGVEHQKSTVIALGPSYDLMGKLYTEFLGVSSHELYHAWNVKAIRPVEMYPYDYSRENYTRLGFVAEGVTTYLGDLFLLKGKVFTAKQYLKELSAQFQRHFNNFGRFNMSVGDSSYDTWLDGYVAGVPNRKVSIYTEGCLLAFILDTMIMRASNNTKDIHTMMQALYQETYGKGKGYSEADYRMVAEEVSGLDLSEYFNRYVYGTATYEGLLTEALDYLGLEMKKEENPKISARVHGMRLNGDKIMAIAPGSPAEMGAFSIEDQILAINNISVINGDIDACLDSIDTETITFEMKRKGRLLTLKMPQVDVSFWKLYFVEQLENPSRAQREAFNKWSSKKD